MTLRFEVTDEDFIAFQEHFRRTSPLIKRQRRTVTLGAVALVFLALFVVEAKHGIPVAMISGLVGAVLIYLWTLLVFRMTPRLSRGLYKTAAQDATGEVELEVTPDGLRTKSKRGESRFYWDALGDIQTTSTHTFLYVGKMQGIIIPQRRILSGNYVTFMQNLADIYANRRDAALQTGTPVPVIALSPVTTTVDATEENEQVTLGNHHATDR